MSIRNVQVKDKHSVTQVAESGAPLLRASVYGTYEYLARCFQRTFFVYLENSKMRRRGYSKDRKISPSGWVQPCDYQSCQWYLEIQLRLGKSC